MEHCTLRLEMRKHCFFWKYFMSFQDIVEAQISFFFLFQNDAPKILIDLHFFFLNLFNPFKRAHN